MSLIDSLTAGRLPSAAQGYASVRHSLLASQATFQGRQNCSRDAWRDISSVGERCWRLRLDSKPAALARCEELPQAFEPIFLAQAPPARSGPGLPFSPASLHAQIAPDPHWR